eukprot:750346-Hanusia_phi.AAC.3
MSSHCLGCSSGSASEKHLVRHAGGMHELGEGDGGEETGREAGGECVLGDGVLPVHHLGDQRAGEEEAGGQGREEEEEMISLHRGTVANLDKLDKQSAKEVQSFIEQQHQIQQIQAIVGKITDICWDKCVSKPGKELSDAEKNVTLVCARARWKLTLDGSALQTMASFDFDAAKDKPQEREVSVTFREASAVR